MLIQNGNRSGLFRWIDDLSDQKIDNSEEDPRAEVVTGVALSVRRYSGAISCSLSADFGSKKSWVFQDLRELKDPKSGLFAMVSNATISHLLAEEQTLLGGLMASIGRTQYALTLPSKPIVLNDEIMTAEQRRQFWSNTNAG
jgi:hypothetical protein